MSLQRRSAKGECPSNRFDAPAMPWTLRSSITTEDAMPYTAILTCRLFIPVRF